MPCVDMMIKRQKMVRIGSDSDDRGRRSIDRSIDRSEEEEEEIETKRLPCDTWPNKYTNLNTQKQWDKGYSRAQRLINLVIP